MKRLVVTYDTESLSATEQAALEGEAVVQAESSDGHPSVDVSSRNEDDLAAAIRDVLDRVHERVRTADGIDEQIDIYAEALVDYLTGRKRIDLVANVLFPEEGALAETLARAADDGVGKEGDGGTVWFDPYYACHDDEDAQQGALLFLMYASADGDGGTFYAPACGDDAELERRLVRCFGDSGWTIDDHDEAVMPNGCTGYRDEQGRLLHDGDTCPIHETDPEFHRAVGAEWSS